MASEQPINGPVLQGHTGSSTLEKDLGVELGLIGLWLEVRAVVGNAVFVDLALL